MNIIGVSVSDRRAAKKRPIVSVTIDEMPVPTNETLTRRVDGITWTSAKYGPLIDFAAGSLKRGPASSNERYHDALEGELSPSGWYNNAFHDGLAPIVDVAVVLLDHAGPAVAADVLEGHWAMQLRRTRSLLRRFDVPWRLLINDLDGQKGRTAWVPVETIHTCGGNFIGLVEPYEEDCHVMGQEHLLLGGIDYWLCPVHARKHKVNQFNYRTTTS